MDISKKLVETHSLTKEECLELFSLFNNSKKDKESTSRLCDYIISRRKIKRNI